MEHSVCKKWRAFLAHTELKQTVMSLIRRRVMRRQILVYTACIRPIKRTLGLYWLICVIFLSDVTMVTEAINDNKRNLRRNAKVTCFVKKVSVDKYRLYSMMYFFYM